MEAALKRLRAVATLADSLPPDRISTNIDSICNDLTVASAAAPVPAPAAAPAAAAPAAAAPAAAAPAPAPLTAKRPAPAAPGQGKKPKAGTQPLTLHAFFSMKTVRVYVVLPEPRRS
jgi:hypothetical protein